MVLPSTQQYELWGGRKGNTMSKRAMAGLVAAVLAAASLMVAAPAYAQPGDPVECFQGLPRLEGGEQSIVWVNGFDVTINPNGTVDAIAIAEFVVRVYQTVNIYAFCVEGDTLDPVLCPVVNIGSLDEYVYTDESGAIHFEGNELLSDLTACI